MFCLNFTIIFFFLISYRYVVDIYFFKKSDFEKKKKVWNLGRRFEKYAYNSSYKPESLE